eukprot:1350685-Prymnesium_polylepis.1
MSARRSTRSAACALPLQDEHANHPAIPQVARLNSRRSNERRFQVLKLPAARVRAATPSVQRQRHP